MGVIDTLRALASRLLGRPGIVPPNPGGNESTQGGNGPLMQGMDGYASFGDWNPWSRYANPISAFFDYYQENPWVRGVCDRIAAEVEINEWVLEDQTTKNATHPDYAALHAWLGAIGFAALRHTAALDLAIARNAFFYIQRNGLGQVVNLIRIPPQTLKPLGGAEVGVTGWKQTVGQKARVFAADEIWHIKGPNPITDIIGLPVLTSLAIDVEADNAMALFNRSYFGNGTQAGMVFAMDDNDTQGTGPSGDWTANDEKKATNKWTAMIRYIEGRYQNPTSAHLPLILRGGFKLLNGGGQSKADAQFLEGRRFNAKAVCSAYGFPPEAIGVGDVGALGGNLSDNASDQLNGVVSYYEGLIDQSFRTNFLYKILGIVGLRTIAKSRTSKITLATTAAVLNLAKAGSFTQNELRAIAKFPRLASGGDRVVLITGAEVLEQTEVEAPVSPTA